MSDIYLMARTVTVTEKVIARMKSESADELEHTRSEKKRDRMIAEGWHLVAHIDGFNISYEGCRL